ncbi:aminoglycoside phosphotransferase family protein [Micromonospora taraxaci]|uniref:phosphotransferase family protein n=1 Tax=Micromonospora taraxaci TaxID=1316803 RepID=UPI0033F39609
MTTVEGEFGVAGRDSGRRLESRSGTGVRPVRTKDGRAAYLKVTPAALGAEAMANARHELRFYTDLGPVAPVRTPKLVNYHDTACGVALLLEAAGAARQPRAWTRGMWRDLGRGLADLHTMPPPTQAHWTLPDALEKALADPDVHQIEAFWAGPISPIAELLGRREELRDQISALPLVFIHGDCHTDNLVHSAGALVFCDWQAARIGRPGCDLAFLSIRATPTGVVIPSDLVDAYLDRQPWDRCTLRRALLAEELATFVFLWPPFAAMNSPLGIARVRRRARDLAEQWFTSTGA